MRVTEKEEDDCVLCTADGPVGLLVDGDTVGSREGAVEDGRDVGCRVGSLLGRTAIRMMVQYDV